MTDRQRTVLESTQADCVRDDTYHPHMMNLMEDRTGLSHREIFQFLSEPVGAGEFYTERKQQDAPRIEIGDISYTNVGARTLCLYVPSTRKFYPWPDKYTRRKTG